MSYASGRNASAICDTCGMSYPYLEMRTNSYGGRVCPTCFDGNYDIKNHPQNKPPPVASDPISLRYPRPDVDFVATSATAKSRHAFGPLFAKK